MQLLKGGGVCPGQPVILPLGSGSTDEVQVDSSGWALSLKPCPSDSETGSHTCLHHSYVRVYPSCLEFHTLPVSSWPGAARKCFSLLWGGRWEGRQAAGKAWWLLNRGFEDLFISD